MKLTIQQKHLSRELAVAAAVAEKKTTIPALTNVCIDARASGPTLRATNLELSLSAPLEAEDVSGSGAICLPAKRLSEYVQLLPDGPVEISTKNSWATIKAGRARTRIAGLSADSFPEPRDPPATYGTLPPRVLAAMIERTRFGISQEQSRFTINGALLTMADGKATMVSTDGHRMCVATATTDCAPLKCIVPKPALDLLAKLLPGCDTLSVGAADNHIHFTVGDRALTAQRFNGYFPDHERVLPAGHPHSATLDAASFHRVLERVVQFADERSRAVRIKVEDGGVAISASASSKVGESLEGVDATVAGAALEIGVNGTYVMDFLRICSGMVRVAYKDAASALVLQPEGDDGYLYVVMPMRI